MLVPVELGKPLTVPSVLPPQLHSPTHQCHDKFRLSGAGRRRSLSGAARQARSGRGCTTCSDPLHPDAARMLAAGVKALESPVSSQTSAVDPSQPVALAHPKDR